MKKMDYEEVITKIATYDGLYYTINKHSREEIIEMKEKREEILKEQVSEGEIIDELVKEDVCKIVTNKDDLIFLPFESKILNKKEIKESVIQFRNSNE